MTEILLSKAGEGRVKRFYSLGLRSQPCSILESKRNQKNEQMLMEETTADVCETVVWY